MNGLIRRRYLFDKITELEKEARERIRKVHLGSAEYQRYMEQLNERSLMKKMILMAPADKTKEAVHGEWVNEYINKYGHPCHCCSICGFKASYQDKNFCPNCGADMRTSEGKKKYIKMIGNYKVITLCGSTRFKKEFEEVQRKLTLEGNIVLSVGLFSHEEENGEDWAENGIKEMLDDIHKRKIDMSDEIFVINKDGYIGSSTASEIEYAKLKRMPIRYMEKENE